MFLKLYHLNLMMVLFMSTLMVLTSNNWFMSWIGLEINLMSMIPLILYELNFKKTEAGIKYFIIQALASILLIFITLLFFYMDLNYEFYLNNSIVSIALLIKAGMAPLHLWFPQITNLMEWNQIMILLTWQKLAPLYLITFIKSQWILISIFLSALVGALGGLNQNKIKLIMAYSSIAHSSWIVTSSLISLNLLFFYYFIYCFIVLSLMNLFKMKNMLELNKIKLNKLMTFFFLTFLLSLAGLPPFLGFIPKFSIILNISYKMMIILMILILSSILSLYFYLRITYNLLLIKNQTKMIIFNNQKKILENFLSISFLLNIFPSVIMLIL